MTANQWHWAEWHTDPELPRIPWRTLESVPPEARVSHTELSKAFVRHDNILAARLTVRVNGRTYPRSAFFGDAA